MNSAAEVMAKVHAVACLVVIACLLESEWSLTL
jgi:hypothetical protein